MIDAEELRRLIEASRPRPTTKTPVVDFLFVSQTIEACHGWTRPPAKN